ncbi:hypothetical protein C0J52_21853 [Blattella germanica]|nr:hypothetical protein C0J52_21853 [Blattella germanica]
MNRCLIPEVRANSYDIIFTPVTKSGDKLTETSKHSLFIVEIRVWPLMMVYMVYQNRKCYTRRGTQTIECTVAQKKKEMMDEEEHDLKEAILALEAAANQDLPTLAKILKDMSPIQFDGIVKMKLKS